MQISCSNFAIDIRVDYRNIHFSEALRQTSTWWESYDELKPASVPDIAKKPLYSTWYQFHQDLDRQSLVSECKLAKELGFESIIIDDGWQTNDNNRGYDYTGDWLPERFPDLGDMVKELKLTGMKVGLWYSVPFCGIKSKAYKKFKDMLLTTEHRWAPVFDPRYPEVRSHLLNIYLNAAEEWKLDGFKLDFIDEFKRYKDTSFEVDDRRDFSSINSAVEYLLGEVITGLKKINQNIFIEFRQKYTGPAIRKYGNMLRAFDCPGDYTMNRVRIADLRMLSGKTAVHADMVTWHFDETVENAALHYINTLFGVPQISIMLNEAPKPHLEMIRFYTKYWNEKSNTFLAENFTPKNPLANYSLKQAESNNNLVVGIYDDVFIKLKTTYNSIDIINAKSSNEVVLIANEHLGNYQCKIFNCVGEIIEETVVSLKTGASSISVPKSGLLQMNFIEI